MVKMKLNEEDRMEKLEGDAWGLLLTRVGTGLP